MHIWALRSQRGTADRFLLLQVHFASGHSSWYLAHKHSLVKFSLTFAELLIKMTINANIMRPQSMILGVTTLTTWSGCLDSRSPHFDLFCVQGGLALLSLTRLSQPDLLPFTRRTTSENKRHNWQLMLHTAKRKQEREKPCVWSEYQGCCLPRASSEVVRQPSFQREHSVFLQHATLRGTPQCALEKHTSEM